MPFNLASRPARLRVIITAAVLAIAGLLIAGSQAGSARAATARTATARTAHAAVTAGTTGAKPTIVLEHGAWADSSSWDGVIQRLQLLGYTVDVPPNPLRSLPDDSAYLADFLKTISGPVILVGHSYGGAVITNAATGNTQVRALVYVDAFIPDQGQTLLQLATATPGSCVASSTAFNVVPLSTGDADLYVKQSVFPGCMANGLPASQAAVLAATQRPLAASVLGEPSGVPAWKQIRSWAVIGTADHAIPPAEQLAMAEHADAHITRVDAPHLSMISDPGVVTAVILQAVRAVG
jgi:pimeloyl-ACP methyl ester carboxylesterase